MRAEGVPRFLLNFAELLLENGRPGEMRVRDTGTGERRLVWCETLELSLSRRGAGAFRDLKECILHRQRVAPGESTFSQRSRGEGGHEVNEVRDSPNAHIHAPMRFVILKNMPIKGMASRSAAAKPNAM